jgi:hypothetical protein
LFFPTHLPLSVPGHLGIRVHSGFEVHIGHIHAHVPGQHDTRSKGESGGCAPGDMPSRAPNPHPAPTWTHAIVPCPRPRTTGPGPVSQMMQFAAMGTNSDIGQENVGGRKTRQEQSRLWVLAPCFPQEICSGRENMEEDEEVALLSCPRRLLARC